MRNSMVTNSSLAPAPQPNPVSVALFQWIERQMQARRGDYTLHRQYYGGEHRVLLTDRLKAFLTHAGQAEFRDNYCPVVVGAMSDRLNVTGFTSTDDGLADWAWETWQALRMD